MADAPIFPQELFVAIGNEAEDATLFSLRVASKDFREIYEEELSRRPSNDLLRVFALLPNDLWGEREDTRSWSECGCGLTICKRLKRLQFDGNRKLSPSEQSRLVLWGSRVVSLEQKWCFNNTIAVGAIFRYLKTNMPVPRFLTAIVKVDAFVKKGPALITTVPKEVTQAVQFERATRLELRSICDHRLLTDDSPVDNEQRFDRVVELQIDDTAPCDDSTFYISLAIYSRVNSLSLRAPACADWEGEYGSEPVGTLEMLQSLKVTQKGLFIVALLSTLRMPQLKRLEIVMERVPDEWWLKKITNIIAETLSTSLLTLVISLNVADLLSGEIPPLKDSAILPMLDMPRLVKLHIDSRLRGSSALSYSVIRRLKENLAWDEEL